MGVGGNTLHKRTICHRLLAKGYSLCRWEISVQNSPSDLRSIINLVSTKCPIILRLGGIMSRNGNTWRPTKTTPLASVKVVYIRSVSSVRFPQKQEEICYDRSIYFLRVH